MDLQMWDERGLWLERQANTAAMKEHLGGVEPGDKLLERHQRYLDTMRGRDGHMWLIVLPGSSDPVGSVGYWERDWAGEPVYEMGWKILPAFQGRGLAAEATLATLNRLAPAAGRRWVHAYPKASNAASNAVCRKAGFTLLGETAFEYPKGTMIVSNDWRLDLSALLKNQARTNQ
ncbi:GNAT family N-acetyltransferase [Actinoplanes sp. NPDC000266]